MTKSNHNNPLWSPSSSQIAAANLTRFIKMVNEKYLINIKGYDELYEWSIKNIYRFWGLIWEFCNVIGSRMVSRTIINEGDIYKAEFFPGATINFAENLLERGAASDLAICFWGEDQIKLSITRKELQNHVSRFAQALRDVGVRPGDRVAAMMPNIPHAISGMLASSVVGAIWSSCSPDFGEQAVLDRFSQIEPKILLACDGYVYNGKPIDIQSKLETIASSLPSVEKIIIVPYLNEMLLMQLPSTGNLPNAVLYEQFISQYQVCKINYEQLPFNHPLFILFSSGTTGVPKCIVHSAGGTLLQHLKEHQLHCDIKPNDRVFYFTTCGWMMWNWLVTGLASGASLMLYDGSPLSPSMDQLYNYIDAENITHFGVSAKYIDALKKNNIQPRTTHNLKSLRMVLSTGSPLVAESFDYFYQDIKQDICLASISGGTDIISCFVLGNPIGPVWRGEIQARGLGMQVEIWNEKGEAVDFEKGELVCTSPFPSRPIGFWNDPRDKKYHAAYYEQFENVWTHGDFAEFTKHQGIIIHGRSDTTLNPGGVRIGTAEIYRRVEKFDEVVECIAVGQDWQDDIRIILFIVMREGLILNEKFINQIKEAIKKEVSPRHVPAKIIQVHDIPRTKSGKISEVAVRDAIHQCEIKNKEALLNPESLQQYEKAFNFLKDG